MVAIEKAHTAYTDWRDNIDTEVIVERHQQLVQEINEAVPGLCLRGSFRAERVFVVNCLRTWHTPALKQLAADGVLDFFTKFIIDDDNNKLLITPCFDEYDCVGDTESIFDITQVIFKECQEYGFDLNEYPKDRWSAIIGNVLWGIADIIRLEPVIVVSY